MKLRPVSLFLLLLMIILSTPLGYTQQDDRPIITVLDFKTSGIASSEVEVFVDYLSSYIVETGVYRVIDRSQRDAILKELEFSASDCTDEGCQLEIGKMLAASQIVVGSIGKVGDRYLLTVKIIDVESGQTLKSGSENYTNLNALIDDTKRLAFSFIGKEVPGLKERDQKGSQDEEALVPGQRRGGAVELGIGYNFITGEPASQKKGWVTATVGYVYQFNNRFGLGGWLGITRYERISMGETEETLYIPLVGIKLVLFNKVDGFAAFLDLGFLPGIGVYYKNWMVGISYFPVTDPSPTSDFIADGSFGFAVGYSLYLGK